MPYCEGVCDWVIVKHLTGHEEGDKIEKECKNEEHKEYKEQKEVEEE